MTPEIDPKHQPQLTALECFQEGYFAIGETKATIGGDTVALVNGVVTVVPGKGTPGFTEIKVGFEESVKAYDFGSHVGTLVDTLAKLGYQANGNFDGDGEESDDFWRLSVDNNQVTQIQGVVTFQTNPDPYLELRERAKNGHGWVLPHRQGAVRANCGGVPGCPDCVKDHFWVQQVLGL